MTTRTTPARLGAAVSALAIAAAPLTTMVWGAAAAEGTTGQTAFTYTPSATWWGTNGRVADIRVVGDRVYLAGGFDYVGPTTGYGVQVSGDTGAVPPGAPKVDGVVRAAVPDGAGGWYIGGMFRKLAGKGRPTLAHITADGTVSPWAPKTDGVVNALALTTSGVLVGGSFTGVNGVPAQNLAMVDRSTGSLVTGWKASANAPVRALAADRSSVYVGGDFTVLNGVARSRLARLSTASGALDAFFPGMANAPVHALAVDRSAGRLYVGGDFTQATTRSGYVGRSRLAAYSTRWGALTSFAPAADGRVQALATDAGGRVYAGGLFSSVGGTSRPRLVQLLANGEVGPLAASLTGCHVRHDTRYAHGLPPCTPEVSALSVSSDVLYVGGRFGASGTAERHNAAAYSLTTGALTGWNPVAGDRPLTVASAGGAVFLGGEFTSVGGVVRRGLAALDASTGAADLSFRADANEYVEALASSGDGSRLYVGGNFTALQGKSRGYLAAVDTASGVVLDSFAPRANGSVLALTWSAGAVYAGGQFTTVNGLGRAHAVKLGGLNGQVDGAWLANTSGPAGPLRRDGMVMGIGVPPDGLTVFLAGPFDAVNGRAVAGGLAVVSGSTGALGPRQLGGVRGCTTGVGPWINRLYLSDDGKRLYGGGVCPDDVYQWDAVALSTSTNPTGLRWRTSCDGGMQGRLEVGGQFFYGTHGTACLSSPEGTWTPRQRYAVLSAATGELAPDTVEFNTPMGVWSFGATGDGLLVGGDFTYAGSARDVQQGLAFFPRAR